MDVGPFASAADACDHHMGRYGAQLAAGLLDVAEIRSGQRVLDVGCGPGPLTRALADRAGADGVAAVDPSADFVEACRARVPLGDVRVLGSVRISRSLRMPSTRRSHSSSCSSSTTATPASGRRVVSPRQLEERYGIDKRTDGYARARACANPTRR
jgi:hypothetical protein